MNAPVENAEHRWQLSLIQTKMALPRPPQGRVGRAALLARLSDGIERTLTVVIAPAGFGKTTLLNEWCEVLRARKHVVGWLTLDEEDDDLQQFGAYVLACLGQGGDRVAARAEALLHDDPLTPVATVASVLLNDIAACGRQVFLVLDDFDRLSSRPIRALVSRLLRYAPPNFHVALGMRGDPGLNLGELQAHDRLLRLGADDLRFSTEDARAYFSQTGSVALDAPSVELLNHATEGWVTGLQLAALAVRDADDAAKVAQEIASNRFGIDAYFESTVLAKLSPPMRQFALRTSILDRLGPEVCDAIMGAGARSWDKLDWLEQRNMFLRAVDEDRRWYRYHALMSCALRRRAERQLATELPSLHRRASRWFAEQQLWPEAVRHALAAGDGQQAAEWVENCAMALVDNSDVRTVLGWIARLPPAIVAERLRLRLAQAWALSLSLMSSEASEAVRKLAAEVTTRVGTGMASEPQQTLVAEVRAVDALTAGLVDDGPRSLELGRAAAVSTASAPAWVHRFAQTAQLFGLIYDGQFDEIRRIRASAEDAARDAGAPLYANVYRTSMFGLSALVEGRLAEAIEIFESALAKAEDSVGGHSAAAALPAGYLTTLYYECNNLERARQMVSGRTAIAMQACPVGSLLRYSRGAARLFAREGDLSSALVILEEARDVAATRNWLRVRSGCDAEAVRLHLLRGEVGHARQLADVLEALMPAQHPTPAGSFLETWTSRCTVQARLAIATGRPGEAVTLLEGLTSRLTGRMAYQEASVALLLALAHERAGRRAEAFVALHRALDFAQRTGMVNGFIDEDEPMRALLGEWLERSPQATDAVVDYARQLQALFADRPAGAADAGGTAAAAGTAGPAGAAGDTAPPSRAGASSLLSAREFEILSHISQGLSNKEIGRALRVAPETIKWHMKNIFEKLNVGSRIEAVQSGLGLVQATPGDGDGGDGSGQVATRRRRGR